MQVKCEFCGSMIEDTAEKCPNCGATNLHMARSANGVPKTIAELKAFCEAKHLDLQKMHFHIGEDYKGPKAFGIYQEEGGTFVVYKNKADGSRAVRYRGTDEAYAVNEIYQKLKVELQEAREWAAKKNAAQPAAQPKKKSKFGFGKIVLIVLIAVLLFSALGKCGKSPKKGYYDYNGTSYYYDNDDWYVYDGVWKTAAAAAIANNYSDYWTGSSYDSSSDYTDFRESDYYENENNWNDDWDDDDWSTSWDHDDDDDDDDWDWDWDDDDDDDSSWDWSSDSDWDSDW